MRLRCECGREFSPIAEEDCPSCGATSRFVKIQGWIELVCPCGHRAWREEDAPDNAVCPSCGKELKRPANPVIHPERPDDPPRRPLRTAGSVQMRSLGTIFALRALTVMVMLDGSSRLGDAVAPLLLVLALVAQGVALFVGWEWSPWIPAALSGAWVWVSLNFVLRFSALSDVMARVAFSASCFLPEGFVLATVLSLEWGSAFASDPSRPGPPKPWPARSPMGLVGLAMAAFTLLGAVLLWAGVI